MNSDIGVMLVPKVDRAIKSCKRTSVSWKDLNSDEFSSFLLVIAVQ